MLTCECCSVKFPALNDFEYQWRQYCRDCFREMGNENYNIVEAGENKRGYKYYKCVPKIKEYAFIDD